MVELTKAERTALTWLHAKGYESFGGSTLVEYYDEKRRAENPTITWSPSLGTCRAWWRTGGRLLARCARKGAVRLRLRFNDVGRYRPEYEFTRAGHETIRGSSNGA